MNKYIAYAKKHLNLIRVSLLSLCLTSTLLAMASTVTADSLNRVLMVEKPLMNSSEIHFPNDERLYPKSSDFRIISYVLLSSELGEREAVLTVENTSSGQRFLERDHLMAIFADGGRQFPNPFRKKFSGKESLTLKITFVPNTYPVLSVYTANK